MTLAMLVKGTEEELFNWSFNLYDINGDGFISREELSDVVHSVRHFDFQIARNSKR